MLGDRTEPSGTPPAANIRLVVVAVVAAADFFQCTLKIMELGLTV